MAAAAAGDTHPRSANTTPQQSETAARDPHRLVVRLDGAERPVCVGLDHVALLDHDPEIRLELDPRNVPGALNNNDHVRRKRAHAGLQARRSDCT